MPNDLQIHPSKINTSSVFAGTSLNDSEMETVLHNVVVISQWNNGWFEFTKEEYAKRCKHQVSDLELRILDWLVSYGALICKDGKYKPSSNILKILEKYI